MKSVKWVKNNEQELAVSPVIATILMVAITVVLAGVLVVYMQGFGNPSGHNIVASISAGTFTNPQDPVTANGGGWRVEVVAVRGGVPNIADLVISVKGSAGAVTTSLMGTSPALKDTTGAVDYYLQSDDLPECGYWNGVVVTAVCVGATGDAFNTIENASIILLDNDASGTLSASDTILVYKDHNGDGIRDVASGSTVEINARSNKIAAADLA